MQPKSSLRIPFFRPATRLISVLILSGQARNLFAADPFRPGVGSQVKLGQEAAADLRKHEKVLPSTDPRVQTLRRVARRLLATFHDAAPWEWSFDVIESKEINAFALPGGATFFFTGLLNKLKTEDELAGVLGHEMTHVRREHWARSYANQQERSLGLALLLGMTRAGNLAYNTAGLANSLFTLKFSRGDETQADDGGFEMMCRAGYNPRGMADVFKMLEDAQKEGEPPEFLSDHPSDKNRVSRIESKISSSGQTFPDETPIDFSIDRTAGF